MNISFQLVISIIVSVLYVTLDTIDSQAEVGSIFPLCPQYLWWCGSLSVNRSFEVILIIIFTWYMMFNTDNNQAKLCFIFPFYA